MSTETTYWTTYGSVRGTCGHRHREPRTALDCLERDRFGCHAAGGYTDRGIVRVPDGTAPGDLRDDQIARRASDVTMGREVDDRPQWADEYDILVELGR